MNLVDESTPIELLLVDDDTGDVLITSEALDDSNLAHNLHVVSDGEEAIRFLRRRGEFADSPRPDLVILDLNLPRLSGREVLALIKDDEDLRRIPVVILSTSDAEEDVLGGYDLHANAYVTKPVDFGAFTRAVRQIDEFFLTVVRLPRR